jgi:hypothetical protein
MGKILQALKIIVLIYAVYTIYNWSTLLVIRYNNIPFILKDLLYIIIALTILEIPKLFKKGAD